MFPGELHVLLVEAGAVFACSQPGETVDLVQQLLLGVLAGCRQGGACPPVHQPLDSE